VFRIEGPPPLCRCFARWRLRVLGPSTADMPAESWLAQKLSEQKTRPFREFSLVNRIPKAPAGREFFIGHIFTPISQRRQAIPLCAPSLPAFLPHSAGHAPGILLLTNSGDAPCVAFSSVAAPTIGRSQHGDGISISAIDSLPDFLKPFPPVITHSRGAGE